LVHPDKECIIDLKLLIVLLITKPKPKMKRNLIVLFFLISFNSFGQSLHLAGIFGDGMVIQQGIHAPVWGITTPNSKVQVEFAGFVTSAESADDGNWMIRMPIFDYHGKNRFIGFEVSQKLRKNNQKQYSFKF